MSFIDKIARVIVRDHQLLVVRTRGNDVFYMPGGKRAPGETDEQTLIREIREELSVDIIPESISYYQTFEGPAHGKPAGTIVRLAFYHADYSGDLQPAAEIAEMARLSYADKHRIGGAGQMIMDDLKAKGLIQ